ncbi:hypothetical protein [Yersinia frederiksenii]|uniref:hypothetical protein n=1 Tax=Yersinia frederiksenii TaxID=29484 RepID=UPI00155DBE3F|nr:hypothetical protein [Yersinia frederiksenii]
MLHKPERYHEHHQYPEFKKSQSGPGRDDNTHAVSDRRRIRARDQHPVSYHRSFLGHRQLAYYQFGFSHPLSLSRHSVEGERYEEIWARFD